MFVYNLWWDTLLTKRGNGKQHMFIYNLWWDTKTTKTGGMVNNNICLFIIFGDIQ